MRLNIVIYILQLIISLLQVLLLLCYYSKVVVCILIYVFIISEIEIITIDLEGFLIIEVQLSIVICELVIVQIVNRQ